MSKKKIEIELSDVSSECEGEAVSFACACEQVRDVLEETLRAMGWTMVAECEEDPAEFDAVIEGLVGDYFFNENDDYVPPSESEASEEIDESDEAVVDDGSCEPMEIEEGEVVEMEEPTPACEEGDAEEVYGEEHPEGCWCPDCYAHPDDAEV